VTDPVIPRICIFCGNPPEAKDCEHPLPQWLLRFTGNPNRSVLQAYDWLKSREIRFSWNAFAFPSCSECNSRFSSLEQQMSGIIPRLCNREELTPVEYVLLLDWLDKVRIGLWLAHRYLTKNPLGISPHFAINTRVGARDRMVAVYPLSSQPRGLNTFGAETLLFQLQPSVFSLRVNDLLLINASWEWMCAARCGFAYPTQRWVSADQAAIIATDFRWRSQTRHPVFKGLHKPHVALFQPTLHEPNTPLGGSADSEYARYRATNFWPNRPGLGPLFRQHTGRTVRINPWGPPIAFDPVSDKDARSFRRLAAQTYLLQIESVACNRWVSDDLERVRKVERLQASVIKFNKRLLQSFRTTTRTDGAPPGEPEGSLPG
jgi:hypothetical protein